LVSGSTTLVSVIISFFFLVINNVTKIINPEITAQSNIK